MFLFRCCMRVDCGCQTESETEVSRSSHSTCDYLQQSEKQIQCRLLPQSIDTSSSKHYSGCSHAVESRSLLVGSTQSVGYEEVQHISIPSRREDNEHIYTRVDDNVICKPPCSTGFVNNNFSLDTSPCNNNLLQPGTSDIVKSENDGGPQNGSGSDESSDVSSASSGADDHNSVEVKYVADIKQFRSTPTSVRPHGEHCCCPACQSLNDNFDRTDGDKLIRHSSDLKCSCKSCSDFYSRMHCITTNTGFTTTVGVGVFSDQYKLISSIVQDSKDSSLTWSQSAPKSSAACRVAECASFDSRYVQPSLESISTSAKHSDFVYGAFTPDEIDDSNGLFSSADELHYVFHKFIDDSRLEEPFIDVSADDRLELSVSTNKVVQSESGIEMQHISARSADDLEVAFFMVGNVSPTSAAPVTPTTQTSVPLSSEHQATENVSSASICELENLSGSLKIAASQREANFCEDANLNGHDKFDIEDQQSYCQVDSGEIRRDVIVQKLADSASLFIGLPAVDGENASDVCGSAENVSVQPSTDTDDTCTMDELSSAIDDVVIDVTTQKCITERPVFISADEVTSSQTADDVSYGDSQQHTTADVASYVHDIVEEAVRQTSDDLAGSSVVMCNIASGDDDVSYQLPKQILISSAPVQAEYDRWFDSLASSSAGDTEPHLASDNVEYFDVGIADADILDADVDISSSNEAICMIGVEAQQVENYLISYDVHLLQQPTVDTAGYVDPVHATRPDKTVASGDVPLQHLVQPLQHVVSESDEEVAVASELNLDSEDSLTTKKTGIDVVEDFFMHYVLPVDSVWYSIEANMAYETALHEEWCKDVPVDQNDDYVVQAKTMEMTAEKIVDVIISDAAAEVEMDAAAGMCELQYELEVDSHEGELALEGLVEEKELETMAENIVDNIISEVSDNVMTERMSSSEDTQPEMPPRSSCLLQSASESHRKKSVHFADMHGLQLETVQHYDQITEPEESLASLEEFLSKLSAAAAERRAKWTEHHPSRGGAWLCNSSVYLLACFELPSSQDELLERVRHDRVVLESCSFDDLALAISGVVRVANIAFHKTLSVRYSLDHWITHTEIDGHYIPLSNDGPTDRFSFTIILPSPKQFAIGSEVEFAICYTAADDTSFKFWDNNHGRNYVVRCCSKAAARDD